MYSDRSNSPLSSSAAVESRHSPSRPGTRQHTNPGVHHPTARGCVRQDQVSCVTLLCSACSQSRRRGPGGASGSPSSSPPPPRPNGCVYISTRSYHSKNATACARDRGTCPNRPARITPQLAVPGLRQPPEGDFQPGRVVRTQAAEVHDGLAELGGRCCLQRYLFGHWDRGHSGWVGRCGMGNLGLVLMKDRELT